jgi:hypothetical protein
LWQEVEGMGTTRMVYIVQRWRKTVDAVDYDLSLDSTLATPESARERVAELEAGLYHAFIDTAPLYETGNNVDPINDQDMVSW